MVSDLNGINSSKTGKPLTGGPGSVGAQPVEQRENTNASSPSSHEDTVHLSPAATELKALETSLIRLPIVDEARVETIKQQIKNGDYQIDPRAIAQKLINLDTYS